MTSRLSRRELLRAGGLLAGHAVVGSSLFTLGCDVARLLGEIIGELSEHLSDGLLPTTANRADTFERGGHMFRNATLSLSGTSPSAASARSTAFRPDSERQLRRSSSRRSSGTVA